jgi:hypothetical protein
MNGEACCKVGRDIRNHGLSRLNDDLRRRRSDGESLRDLATFVNTRILENVLADAGISAGWDAETTYRILAGADADVSTGRRAETRSKLKQVGVDVDCVKTDFVSHQTIRDHLRDCLDIDTGRETRFDVGSATTTVEWARSRSEAVIERTLDRLRAAGELETSDLDVTHSVRVTCEGCGRTYRLRDLLKHGHCECNDTGNEANGIDSN